MAARKPRNYLSNENILVELAKSHEFMKKHPKLAPAQCMSATLVKQCMTLVQRYGQRYNFAGYRYNDEMQADALMALVRSWWKFDAKKSRNPFSYFTMVVHRTFLNRISLEKGHAKLRDDLIEFETARTNSDVKPSFARQGEVSVERPAQLGDLDQ